MDSATGTILILDKEQRSVDACSGLLKGSGFSVKATENIVEFRNILSRENIDFIIIDSETPEEGGIQLLSEVKKKYPETEVLVISAIPTVEIAVEAVKAGAFKFLEKPVDPQKLLLAVKIAVGKKQLGYGFTEIVTEKRTSFLEKISIKKSYGLYIENNKVYFSEVHLTLKGPRLIRKVAANFIPKSFGHQVNRLIYEKSDKIKEPVTESKLNEVLRKLLKKPPVCNPVNLSELNKKSRPLFASAIPGSSLYYNAVPIQVENINKLEASALIQENPRFAFVDSADIVSDWMITNIGERNFVFLGAAKKKVARKMLSDYYQIDINPIRIEPEPWAALRASWHYMQPMGKKSPEIRVLFGDNIVLIALSCGKIPITWKQVEIIDRQSFTETLKTEVYSLIVYAHGSLRFGDIKNIVFQSEDNVEEYAKAVEDATKKKVFIMKGVKYDGFLVSFGLAIGALEPDAQSVNLVKSIQRPVDLKMLMPWSEVFASIGMVVLVLFMVLMRLQTIDSTFKRVSKENAMSSWSIGKPLMVLEAEKTKMREEIEPLGQYLGKKITWTQFFDVLPQLIPASASVSSIEAEDQIWQKMAENKFGSQFWAVRAAAEFQEGGKAPMEIDTTLSLFRNSPVMAKVFPKVEVAGINWKKEETGDMSFFTIVSKPKSKE